eukprot:gnl/Spiro4/29348_TR14368_c0_g1_i1.p2 gnl/Spiro4/29348_TR14368_c0_g1~~gnl/Spiro4/29348_TR14368_c0_g1_i1.p2  ORF type:complete len:476 (-),score=145.22 gnl/Spiro4/29348_TR14368_c0_g1_i1:140-1537(-)
MAAASIWNRRTFAKVPCEPGVPVGVVLANFPGVVGLVPCGPGGGISLSSAGGLLDHSAVIEAGRNYALVENAASEQNGAHATTVSSTPATPSSPPPAPAAAARPKRTTRQAVSAGKRPVHADDEKGDYSDDGSEDETAPAAPPPPAKKARGKAAKKDVAAAAPGSPSKKPANTRAATGMKGSAASVNPPLLTLGYPGASGQSISLANPFGSGLALPVNYTTVKQMTKKAKTPPGARWLWKFVAKLEVAADGRFSLYGDKFQGGFDYDSTGTWTQLRHPRDFYSACLADSDEQQANQLRLTAANEHLVEKGKRWAHVGTQFNGQYYKGMPVGLSHTWTYDDAPFSGSSVARKVQWHETKVNVDRWLVDVTGVLSDDFPPGCYVLLADQIAERLPRDNNAYHVEMHGALQHLGPHYDKAKRDAVVAAEMERLDSLLADANALASNLNASANAAAGKGNRKISDMFAA